LENWPIGIFDSGVGGLTVVREIKRMLPRAPIIYFGDTARTPYGIKSRKTLIRYAIEDADFLISKGARIIVIACHSAASTATAELRRYLDLPVFEVVSPSVTQACAITRNGRIGIMGTRATVASGVYPELIPAKLPSATVVQQACPLLVPLVEEGWLKRRETRMIVKGYLRPLKNQGVDTLVLGCTHYPLLKPIITAKAGRKIRVVDPSEEVAKSVREFILGMGGEMDFHRETSSTGEKRDRFYLSDLAPHTAEIVKRFLGEQVVLEEVIV